MRTWARVDLPEPLGPMTACTSPLSTSRSIPRRISWPGMPPRSPCTRSRLTRETPRRSREHHLHLVALEDDLVHGNGLGGREGESLAGLQGEGAAVLPALDLLVLGVHLALRKRVVGMAAPVADGVEVLPDPDQGDPVPGHVEPLSLAGGQLVPLAARHDLSHHGTPSRRAAALITPPPPAPPPGRPTSPPPSGAGGEPGPVRGSGPGCHRKSPARSGDRPPPVAPHGSPGSSAARGRWAPQPRRASSARRSRRCPGWGPSRRGPRRTAPGCGWSGRRWYRALPA